MLLTIDTSAGTAVALVDPGSRTVLGERETADTRRHAEVVGPFLAGVLADAGVGPDAVTGVVAGMGPGPFTGLRVGIAAARTFAVARSVPFLPVVSHDAVAAADAGDGPLVVLTDARRRELYWSVYRPAADGSLRRTAGPGLARPEDLDAALGDAADLRRVTAATIPAGRLGLLASERRAAGSPFADDEPLYLRDPDVTMPGAPKRVRS